MGSSLAELLRECRTKYENYPVFQYREENHIQNISFWEFCMDVRVRQAYYESMPQERIGLWAYNSYEWIVSAVGLLLAGKTMVLLDANLSVEQLIRLCRYTDTELLMADEEMMDEATPVMLHMPMLSLKEAAKGEVAGDEFCSIKEGQFICFTSGTTKSSKGVVIRTETLCGCVRAYQELAMGNPGEKFYVPLPYYHIYAFTYIFHILYCGGIHCIGQMGRYLAEDLKALEPEIAVCVPSIISYMLEKECFPEQLKLLMTGGSHLRPELGEKILSRGIALYNVYGSSEMLGVIGYSTAEKGLDWLKPLKGNRFITGENGELGVILPFHMEEYYRKPDETCEVLKKDRNLFWTGDACKIDEDGYARISGRIRDMIVLENGEKIHAEDTDAELSDLSGVREAAVIGIEGKLVAVLVPESAEAETEALRSLKKYNRQRASGIRIGMVWFLKHRLPRTTIGKLKRAALEQEYRTDFVRRI